MADITLKNVQLNIKWKKDASANRPALIPTNTIVYVEKTLSSKPTGWPVGYYLDSNGNEPASSEFVSGTYYQATTVTDGTGYVNENLSTTLSKVMRHLTDLKSTAYTDTTSTITVDSNDLVATAGAVATYVQTAIEGLPKPMVFRGTLGTGGTITSLPVNGTAEIGDTYKVITSDTYSSQPAKVGDVFVCDTKTENTNTWTMIPAGDDVEDTWRSIKVNGAEKLGSGITTGAINFANGTNTTVEWTAGTNTLKINASSGGSGHYTQVSSTTAAGAYQIGEIVINGTSYCIYGINSDSYTVNTELIPRTGSTPTTASHYYLTGTLHHPSGEGIGSNGGLYEDTSIYMSGTTGSLYATKFIGGSETQSSGDNTSAIATTAFVQGELGDYIPKTGSTSLSGTFRPSSSSGATLGTSSYKFANIYTAKLNDYTPGAAMSKGVTTSLSNVGNTESYVVTDKVVMELHNKVLDHDKYLLGRVNKNLLRITCLSSGTLRLADGNGTSTGSYSISNGQVTVTNTTSGNTGVLTLTQTLTVPVTGTYWLSGCPSGGSNTSTGYQMMIQHGNTVDGRDIGSGVSVSLTAGTVYSVKIQLRSKYTSLIFKPMLLDVDDKATIGGNTDFTPCLPHDLYSSYAKYICDRCGSKNKLKITASTSTTGGVTFTRNSDDTWTLSGTSSQSSISKTIGNIPNSGGPFVLFCGVDGSAATWRISVPYVGYDFGEGLIVPTSAYGNAVQINIPKSGANTNGVVIKPLLCSLEDFNISQEYVQWAPSNREIYDLMKTFHTSI